MDFKTILIIGLIIFILWTWKNPDNLKYVDKTVNTVTGTVGNIIPQAKNLMNSTEEENNAENNTGGS